MQSSFSLYKRQKTVDEWKFTSKRENMWFARNDSKRKRKRWVKMFNNCRGSKWWWWRWRQRRQRRHLANEFATDVRLHLNELMNGRKEERKITINSQCQICAKCFGNWTASWQLWALMWRTSSPLNTLNWKRKNVARRREKRFSPADLCHGVWQKKSRNRIARLATMNCNNRSIKCRRIQPFDDCKFLFFASQLLFSSILYIFCVSQRQAGKMTIKKFRSISRFEMNYENCLLRKFILLILLQLSS